MFVFILQVVIKCCRKHYLIKIKTKTFIYDLISKINVKYALKIDKKPY